MPRLYRHRVNSIDDLRQTPPGVGVEFDLRSEGNDVVITHDPFTMGPSIDDFFPLLGPRPCIFNVKCEGIEERIMAKAAACGIDDYFFLDCSIPAAVKLARKGETRLAVRYSEMEPLEGIRPWIGKAAWVWVDCFTRYPTDAEAWEELSQHFRMCVVSPELQGHGADAIPRFRASLGALRVDAACTKRLDLWPGDSSAAVSA